MGPYSYCLEKGLVYIAIVTPFGRQSSSCLEYTKLNIHSGCNIRSILDGEYIHSITLSSL